MTALLASHFQVERVWEKQFVCWQLLNWRGKLTATARLMLNPLVASGKNLVFEARAVSRRVNSPANDGPELIVPVSP